MCSTCSTVSKIKGKKRKINEYDKTILKGKRLGNLGTDGTDGNTPCVFCGRAIMDNDFIQDDFTWGKPAHKKCYDDKKADLKQEGLNCWPSERAKQRLSDAGKSEWKAAEG